VDRHTSHQFFPLTELELMLNKPKQISKVFGAANWLQISLTDVSDGQIPCQRLFSERPNLDP
jgi:hypothetical protein